jgi:arabinose-5-phosphate isomerase
VIFNPPSGGNFMSAHFPRKNGGGSKMSVEKAREVLKIEAQAILDLAERVGEEFERAVSMIFSSKGRVILTGMGKSGLIGRKIVATLNSTGTPSLFLHPAEAIHGDLGMVTRDDVIVAVSNSGHTAEINAILPIIKSMGTKIIALTGGLDSPLAETADVVIDVAVEREACPMGLAPTASTTAALAMGDALAVALIGRRHFNPEDFRRFHPGGSLGDRLRRKVREVMRTGDRVPSVRVGTLLRDALNTMNERTLGATIVVDSDSRLTGIITDGDLRRCLSQYDRVHELPVEEVMTRSPRTITEDQSTAEAIGIMELYSITLLVIVDAQKKVKGVVHLHDLLGGEDFRVNENSGQSFTTQGPGR